MKNQFICKVRYTKQVEDGKFKKVNELYLVEAFTFGDAENQVYHHLGEIIKGEFIISAITKTNFENIIDDSEEYGTWFEVKVRYEDYILDTEKPKMVTRAFMITAADVEDAYNRMQDNLKSTLTEFTIPSVKESNILEVFEHVKIREKETVEA